MNSSDPPIFSALSTSARQLYLLLRCISFTPKAEVQITPEGLRFSAEEARVIQGLAFLEKGLFTSYVFNEPAAAYNNSNNNDPASDDSTSETSPTPNFQISLAALLETLQIFGISDPTSSSSSHSFRNPNGGFTSTYPTAFTTPSLALHSSGGTCRISYRSSGSPLSITITEGGVTTTCDLTTYEPASNYLDEGIPLQRDALTLKIIMRSTWLSDAITELANTNPTVLVINASNTTPPFFALEGQGGPFGDGTVEFLPTSTTADSATSSARSSGGSSSSRKTPLVTETFSVAAPAGTHGRVRQRYRFDLIRKAARAMALASKVSVRQDRQGVLSLQFMIEIGGDGAAGGNREGSIAYGGGGVTNGAAAGAAGGQVTFVDFRFVPLIDEEEDEDGDETHQGGSDEEL